MIGKLEDLDFDKCDGLIPAVVQHWKTNQVLMLGYMNNEAFQLTQSTGKVTFFSRSKERIWEKGETSGNFLLVKEIKTDCDRDTILVKADPVGPTCHAGSDTCFGESLAGGLSFLSELSQTIADRARANSDDSYVASLLGGPIKRVAQKVGEEAVEVVLEAQGNSDELFLGECADLVFHLMVLLQARGLAIDDVVRTLEGRRVAR